MDWIRIVYWIGLIIVWIELVVVWCLIWRNWKNGKKLDELAESYKKGIAAFRFAQEAYEEKLAELREEEESDEGDNNNHG